MVPNFLYAKRKCSDETTNTKDRLSIDILCLLTSIITNRAICLNFHLGIPCQFSLSLRLILDKCSDNHYKTHAKHAQHVLNLYESSACALII